MAFGIEVYGPNGNTLLSMSSRVTRFAQQGTFNIIKNSNTTVNVPGMVNNDSWGVFLISSNSPLFNFTYTLNTGFFRVENLSSANSTVLYWVVRS